MREPTICALPFHVPRPTFVARWNGFFALLDVEPAERMDAACARTQMWKAKMSYSISTNISEAKFEIRSLYHYTNEKMEASVHLSFPGEFSKIGFRRRREIDVPKSSSVNSGQERTNANIHGDRRRGKGEKGTSSVSGGGRRPGPHLLSQRERKMAVRFPGICATFCT